VLENLMELGLETGKDLEMGSVKARVSGWGMVMGLGWGLVKGWVKEWVLEECNLAL
jgi:hypothetical protein